TIHNIYTTHISIYNLSLTSATTHPNLHSFSTRRSSDLSDMDLAAKGLGAKEWNNSLKTKLSLLPKKLFRIRMSRNLGSSDSLVFSELFHSLAPTIGRAVQQECRDRARMPSVA